jgi:oligosaccharide repeat unit polymerase
MLSNIFKYLEVKYLFILTLIFFFVLGFHNHILSFKNFILLNSILLIHLIIFIDYLKNEQNQKQLPILLVISSYIFISYTLSFYLEDKDFFYNDFTSEILTKSLIILIIACCALYLGYYISRKFFSIRTTRIFYFDKIDHNKIIILFFSFILMITIIFLLLTQNFSSLSFITQLKEPVIFFTLGLNLLMIIKKDTNLFFLYTLFFLSLFLIFFLEILSGVLILIFSILIFLSLIQLIMTKRLSILLCLIFTICIIFAPVLKSKIRALTWNSNKSFFEKITVTQHVINNDLKDIKINNLKSFKARIFHPMNSLNIVSKLTPFDVPFYEGGSYKFLHAHLIPRLIWKNKPKEEYGNFWGHRYNILESADKTTSWNFPVINEFYANFGMPGVALGMFLLGFLSKFLALKLTYKKNSDIEFLVSATILFNFFFLENNLGQLIGRIYNQLIFFNIIFLFSFFIFKYFAKIYKNIF